MSAFLDRPLKRQTCQGGVLCDHLVDGDQAPAHKSYGSVLLLRLSDYGR